MTRTPDEPAFVAFLKEIMATVPLDKRLGVQVEDVKPDTVVMRLPYQHENTNGLDVVHGGAIAALIDAAGTAAFWATDELPANPRGSTVALSINYLSAARKTDLIATGTVIRRGGSISVGDVWVHDPDGRAIARATVTYKLSGG